LNHGDTEDTEDDTMERPTKEVTEAVIGAAIEVHCVLGPGYLESVYEEALAVELELRGVSFQKQPTFALQYKGHAVGEGRLDFLVENCLILELKAVDALAEIQIAQAISYLKATGHHLALLINFNVSKLVDGVKRVAL
jgi:GxxExxY protein